MADAAVLAADFETATERLRRERVDSRIDEVDRHVDALSERLTQRLDLEAKALDAALQSLTSKLADMNEFRGALTDLSLTMITRKEAEVALVGLAEKFDASLEAAIGRGDAMHRTNGTRIDSVADKVEMNARTNWPLIISMLTVLAVLVTGIWAVISLKIDASLSPIREVTEGLKTESATTARAQADTSSQVNRSLSELQSTAQAVATERTVNTATLERLRLLEAQIASEMQYATESRTDRAQINSRLGQAESRLTTSVSDRRATDALVKAKLAEIETQFKGMSIVLNIHKDGVQQILTMLWAKAFPGDRLPPTPYRPDLFNAPGSAAGIE